MNKTSDSTAFIALGANLENPLEQIDDAVEKLNNHRNITCTALSPIYESIPHGDIEQPNYLNAALKVVTSLTPQELLLYMHKIETQCGRVRTIRWEARTLDLDLILYNQHVIDSDDLTLPHPRAWEREFVIKPLYDLDKKLIIPNYGAVMTQLQTLPIDSMKEIRHGITYHH